VVLEHLTQDFINAPTLVSQVAFVEPVDALPRPPLQEIPEFLLRFNISSGIFAVALFFLISGFVIPFSLEHRSLGAFAVRRLFRLYPTLWCCIGLTVVAVVLFSGHRGFPYSGSTIATSALLTSGYAGRQFVDPVYWTLAIEEIFYVCAAVVAWRGLLHRRTTILAVAAVLSVVAMSIGNPRVPSATDPTVVSHYALRALLGANSTFVIFILIGVVFHQHYRRRWATVECLAMGSGLLGLFYVCLQHGPFVPYDARVYFSCCIAALVVFLPLYVLRDRIPYSRSVDHLGDISYPLYLIHTTAGWVLLNTLTRATGHFYVALPLTFLIVIGLAVAVHHAVEKPSRELGRRIAGRPRFRSVARGEEEGLAVTARS